jgi:hypothetical protein
MSPAVAYSQSGTNTAEAAGPTLDWSDQKTPAIHEFTWPKPDEYMAAIEAHRIILRTRVTLPGSIRVEFSERPKDIDFYDSSSEVFRQDGGRRTYDVGELIHHQALHLTAIALVPSVNGTGRLICAYLGGAVGARAGFAVLYYSRASADLSVLPLTDFGKIVVSRSKPEEAEIWSALSDYVGTDADPRHYSKRTCRLQAQGFVCGPGKRIAGRFAPEGVNQPGIEIRP